MSEMELKEAIVERRCIRRFDKRSVSDAQINELLEAARWAPSAGNLQSRFFFVVKDKEKKKMLAEAALGQNSVAEAPVVFVVCADLRIEGRYGSRGKELYCLLDCGAAIQNILLKAYEMGLGSVWVGAFDEGMVSGVLELPKHLKPISIIPIGYPAEKPIAPKRREIKEISTIV